MAMYVEERGNKNGRTIVFLHGGGVGGWMWEEQLKEFQDFHCLIPDLPEHGKSMEEGPITIEDCSLRIAELIQQRANDGHAIVIGHSIGAKVLVQLLSDHPELVEKAVVASALFRSMPSMNAFLNRPTYRLVVWMMKSGRLLDMQARQFKFPNSTYEENFKRDTRATTVLMLERIYDQLNKHLTVPIGLYRARMPVLVVAGDKEPRAMKDSVEDIAGMLPNASTKLLPGALHNYPWAKAQEFNQLLRVFIES
jgi:pimeloyl-ACP methyl ester carboxylesterase